MQKPLPRITSDNRPFWDGCRRHELTLPFCTACGKAHLPPGPVCPHCFASALAWRRVSGRGRISSWVIVHKPWLTSFASELPYNVVQVELEEGPRLTASVVGAHAHHLAVGMPVAVEFDDVSDQCTLPRFRVLEPASA